jgi:hypothetical protein
MDIVAGELKTIATGRFPVLFLSLENRVSLFRIIVL